MLRGVWRWGNSHLCICDPAQSSWVRTETSLLPQYLVSIPNLATWQRRLPTPTVWLGMMVKLQLALTSPSSPIDHLSCSVCPAGNCRIPRHTFPSHLHGEASSRSPSWSSACCPHGLVSWSLQTGPGVFPVLLFPTVGHEDVGCITSLQGGLENFAKYTGNWLRGTTAPQTQPFPGAEVKP